ncbi:antibiotic biosynthesis monooxygenase [Roseococcus sp. SDR]|uniref:putative quinol monooxygenase n=1 Tax=Roseococcus sp. SDR TaxID=2835532 RepID=UPI001BD08B92|nr:putative quinol monooxygenase [Roseococcus sp. SDR]MBS7788553.1 antibiotic biosynthesis monooxygenase [Roseococcus sp. SDR]MBV1843867.1 antibiotic biosynthesis monooxygenase [Roseococcus sp. SDR]
MAKIALVVEFKLKPGAHAAFDAIIRDHAAGTLSDEPGCERFDVLQPGSKEGPDLSRVMLYEVYADDAAFKAHTQNPRLARTRAAYESLIEDRTIHICKL